MRSLIQYARVDNATHCLVKPTQMSVFQCGWRLTRNGFHCQLQRTLVLLRVMAAAAVVFAIYVFAIFSGLHDRAVGPRSR